ncbi:hypothetical protein GIW54_21935 [Pseudomonas proteolytica]|uniref:Uncharacterized protein n=1 Tax=Pseudomonas proteolytica TaxID=219574 RepID=A0AAW5A0V0_9PSED|nr:hypothetical protein [Pseudomonas proteolytica]MCF5057472.1 hypothetical protein [Pseudomonas proteolytica]MCF5103378.1 hypothetical protein [Pseudomonas proteolytica]
MGTKHTPGPWYVQDDHGKRWIETEGNDDTIAEVHRRKRKGSVYSCEEAGANADLIAAAPDLLSALQGLLAAYEDPGNTGSTHDDKVQAARNAISKAAA